MPSTVIPNSMIASLVERYEPGKGAAWAEEKLGIRERRFMASLDSTSGRPTGDSDEVSLAEQAARRALDDAGLTPDSVGGLWYVSCTQSDDRQHFSATAHELHRRLGLPADALALEMDAGCGGALHAIAHARRLLLGGAAGSLLVIASNGPSKFYMDWESYLESGAWLSMYVFGDGAGAAVLSAAQGGSGPGILCTYTAVDPSQPLMEMRSAGRSRPVYYIDGRGVAVSFGVYASRALSELRSRHPFELGAVSRFYFHQVNGKVLERFIAGAGIPADKVATHVDRYGNMAAAATLVLLDEDRKAGRVHAGDLCVFCTVGAGAQYGAMLVRL